MGQKTEGGIKENQDLERFTASTSDIAPKDQIDLMARCWFSLTANRTEPIEHVFEDARSGKTETIRVTGSAEHGIATIHDQDLIIFAISQWIEAKRAGRDPTRRIYFTPYQFFSWMNKAPQGTAYKRLKEALHRLKTTNIETSIRSTTGTRKGRVKQFSWISEWEINEDKGAIRGVEVVLAEWLFESIQNFQVLTLDKRYFEIPGPVERWLYLYARKATGGAKGVWKESFKSLHKKSASQQEYKHYASTLRKLIKRDELPGLHLEGCKSSTGLDMLRMERIEKRIAVEAEEEAQLSLIEKTPVEESWETAIEILIRRMGESEVNAWVKPLELLGLENGVLRLRGKTKFIADWVEGHYTGQIIGAWQSIGHEVKTVRIEARTPAAA